MTSTLSPREARFVAVYSATMNAAEAARQAGYKSARQAGHRLLKRPEVAAEIRRRQQALSQDLALSAQRVVKAAHRELMRAVLAVLAAENPTGDFEAQR